MLAAQYAPSLIYQSEHGPNRTPTVRGPLETEVNSLKLVTLVLPVAGHRLEPLAALTERYQRLNPFQLRGESTSLVLGLLGTVGFLWLLAVALAAGLGARGPLLSRPLTRHAAIATLLAFLLGTFGGASALFAYFVSGQLRGWGRIAIVIAFMSLLGLGLLLDALGARLNRRGRPRLAFAAALVAVVAVGLLDQTAPRHVPPYGYTADQFASDAGFVHEIERRLPPAAMVFELPYVPYPSSQQRGGFVETDMVTGYLHSTRLRWSYGAMRSRPANWQADAVRLPVATLLDGVVAAGFSGLYVDRAGYGDGGAGLQASVAPVLGPPALASRAGLPSGISARSPGAFVPRTGRASSRACGRRSFTRRAWSSRTDSRLRPLVPMPAATGCAMWRLAGVSTRSTRQGIR